MYLSKLEIFGFKSFAQKTVVHFNKGVNGIVGPNGCGKTNIVDAIRWCLGEQKSSTLRSDKMENVIFNGTASKKPLGMSEVSLTLVNDNGLLPTEYSEITITRRIYRSGESEYLLNKNICRLKDITNLFMDTGMGTNAYSVIELKMVETILSNKAEERRNMFEEAAGVNKYKLRRRLALKKLEEVKKDLTRVNDIVNEVDKKVTSLERQAKRADKYNNISSILREVEVDLAEREYSLWNLKRIDYRERKEIAFGQKIQIESKAREVEDELSVFRSEIIGIENELKQKRFEISAQVEKLHKINNAISISNERKKSLEKNIEKYKQELEELRFQDEDADDTIVETEDKTRTVTNQIAEKEKLIEENIELINTQKEFLTSKRSELKIQQEQIFSKFKDITDKEHQLKSLKKSCENTNKGIEKQQAKITASTNSLAKTVGYLEDLETEKIDLENKIGESERNFQLKQDERANLEKELSNLKDKEYEERTAINSLKDKIEFLQSLLINLEGVSKGTKVLLENDEWKKSERNLLADVGDSKDEYKFALEAALKGVLNNLLIESFGELNEAVNYLKQNDLGKASFYILNGNENKGGFLGFLNRRSLKKKIKLLKKENEFLGWADSFIITKDKWKPFFKKILSKTALTKDLDSALLLSKKYPDFNFATLNGDFISQSGLVEAGSSTKLDDTLFGRKMLLQDLRNEYPKYEANLERLKEFIKETEEKVEAIDLKELSDQNKILYNDLANIEKQIAQFEFEKKKIFDEIEKTRTDMKELSAIATSLDKEINDISTELENEISERKNAENALAEIELEVRRAESEFGRLNSLQNQTKLELERLRGEKKNLENVIQRTNQNKENIKRSIQKRENDIEISTEEAKSLENEVEDKYFEYDELESDRKKLVAVESSIDEKLREVRIKAQDLEKQFAFFRKERDRVSDEIQTSEIKINEINLKVDNLLSYIKENYSLTLELKEFDDLDSFNFQERSSEVQSLKQQLKNLGPINLLAYSEYDEEKQRLDFLLQQRNDLVESEKDLIKTIEEINNTAQSLFFETFQQIRENFINIFRNLFNPGDEADLKIEEGVDPLEAKIEIIAKPKGKRPTSIELLSGGEKTLTATALLFAIYLVKPSPFCILDEVDAPLDDANVDRFTRIIHQFSNSTQFIIVTHNKRTMESADTLYGVTMQEEGISKLVSVMFNEELDAFAK